MKRTISWVLSVASVAGSCLVVAAGASPDEKPLSGSAPAVKPSADAAKPDPRAEEFFEKKVRPLLAAHCFACHSGASTQGELDLSSREKVLAGGGLGPAIVPGDPDKSLLIRAVRYQGEPKMPPRGKIPDDELATLTEWVKMGAPWPGSGVQGSGFRVQPNPGDTSKKSAGNGAAFWAFRAVKMPAVPVVKDRAWVKTPVDAFVLAQLEKKGLKPNPAADRRTLIRRATFDLTGLPPTPDEVEAFQADRAPNAWEKVIDRLLASPAYGERWGRHWLDVVRFADSNGLDWNEIFPDAWRYRDYVIKSFNEDKPYDEFIKEQLAGDLLPSRSEAEAHEHLIATGMLVMGPKLLAQQDRIKLGMDVVDEQIDVTSKSFLGLTVSCARCHDHKFDPIPTKDYYALAGIFRSTVTLKGTLPRNDRVMYWNERPLAPADQVAKAQEHATRVKSMQAAIKKCKDADEKQRLNTELTALEKSAPAPIPMAMAVSEGKPANCPVHLRGSYANLGPEVPRGFLAVLGGPKDVVDTKQSGRRELADWIASARNPLTGRVLVNRVWLHHFGDGIVRTPDDFGARGERPSNPELLDFLAAAFVSGVPLTQEYGSGGVGGYGRGAEAERGQRERVRVGEGVRTGTPSASDLTLHPTLTPNPPRALAPTNACNWSIKRLHRLIMLSSAYQMSSAPNPVSYAKDPDNRLLWRMNRTRLEAEAIRDAMLVASGNLDATAGGTLVSKTTGFPVKEFPVDFNSRRRSVYLPALRVVTYDLLKVFDFAEPSIVIGKRNRTTVPTQALVMLNSPFVTAESKAFATSILELPVADDRQRVEAAYARALGREPTSSEVGRVQKFLEDYDRALADQQPDSQKRRAQAWSSFCQTLFASTEFRYLD